MSSKSRKSRATALKAAARAVMSHNDELAAHLERGVAIFTESPPISERLKCETNGAHKYIEDFATALKAFQRGCGTVQLVMADVKVSCIDLVLALKETERLLPASVTEADRRAFLDGCEMVINEETIFANLVSGVSGTSPDCPHGVYCRRIDNSVNSIKKHLTELNIAIQHIERDLRSPANPPPPPNEKTPSPVSPPQPNRRSYATRKAISVPRAAEITELSESTIKRLDKDPGNTNYPGRNATAKILAAWARIYREDRLAAREVRAANRPGLGLDRR